MGGAAAASKIPPGGMRGPWREMEEPKWVPMSGRGVFENGRYAVEKSSESSLGIFD
jgi:hypothetical protein